MALFLGQDLFGSGPSSVSIERSGRLYYAALQGSVNPDPYAYDVDVRPLELVQRGRLVGATTTDLWGRIDAIRAVAEGVTEGVLVTDAGISISGLRLMRFEHDVIEIGSQSSCAYTCLYIRGVL